MFDGKNFTKDLLYEPPALCLILAELSKKNELSLRKFVFIYTS